MIPHRPPHIHPDNHMIFISARTYGGFLWLAQDDTKRYFLDKLKSVIALHNCILDAYVICDNHYHVLVQVEKGESIPKIIQRTHGATAHYIKSHFPEMVSLGDQIITRPHTPLDTRQTMRMTEETTHLERRLKSATTEENKIDVVAQFIAHHPKLQRRLKSATTGSDVLAKFISRHGILANFSSRLSDPHVLALLLSDEPPIWHQYMDHVIRDQRDYYMHLNYIHQNPVKHGLATKMSAYPWSSIHTWVAKKGKEFIIDCFRQYPIADFQPIAE